MARLRGYRFDGGTDACRAEVRRLGTDPPSIAISSTPGAIRVASELRAAGGRRYRRTPGGRSALFSCARRLGDGSRFGRPVIRSALSSSAGAARPGIPRVRRHRSRDHHQRRHAGGDQRRQWRQRDLRQRRHPAARLADGVRRHHLRLHARRRHRPARSRLHQRHHQPVMDSAHLRRQCQRHAHGEQRRGGGDADPARPIHRGEF